MATVNINSWSRCEECDKYKATQKQLSEGDKVNFPVVTSNRSRTRVSIKTGKVLVVAEDYVSVVYRKKLTRCDYNQLSDPNGASELAVAMLGKCECKE